MELTGASGNAWIGDQSITHYPPPCKRLLSVHPTLFSGLKRGAERIPQDRSNRRTDLKSSTVNARGCTRYEPTLGWD